MRPIKGTVSRWMVAGAFALVGAVLVLAVRSGGFSSSVWGTASIFAPAGQTLSTEGSITVLNLNSSRPVLILTEPNGDLLKLHLEPNAAADPNATLVAEQGRVVKLKSLEKGQRVKVRYVVKNGAGVATYIEIMTPKPMPHFPREGRPL